ncbi:MAG TPA: hypothetical protein VE820_00150 [Sphingomicrobium sp.]|nr:hypothetical protein [Sphingomicrobium sp.]
MCNLCPMTKSPAEVARLLGGDSDPAGNAGGPVPGLPGYVIRK